MENKNNSFEVLSAVNLNGKVKEKIGLRYLSWAYAWGELKKNYPDATYTIYTRKIETTETQVTNFDGVEKTTVNTYENDVPYFTDGKTCYVKVGVTVNDFEYVEYLPIMDNKNNAVRLETITSTLVNKALQRAFVKACARHGLGLYIYAGEDLPETEKVEFDFDAYRNEANGATYGNLTFNEVKNDIIVFVKKYQDNVAISEEIYGYVTDLFPGKKLSTLTETEDKDNAIKLYTFLSCIDRAVTNK